MAEHVLPAAVAVAAHGAAIWNGKSSVVAGPSRSVSRTDSAAVTSPV